MFTGNRPIRVVDNPSDLQVSQCGNGVKSHYNASVSVFFLPTISLYSMNENVFLRSSHPVVGFLFSLLTTYIILCASGLSAVNVIGAQLRDLVTTVYVWTPS